MGSTKYIQVNVNILTSLQLSQDNICELNVVPPQFRSAFSVYTSADGTKYHLHSELVDDMLENGNIISKCWLCASCNNALMDNKKIPKLSIAAGVDFGDPARIGLPTLTLTEEYLIAQGRLLVSSEACGIPTFMSTVCKTRACHFISSQWSIGCCRASTCIWQDRQKNISANWWSWRSIVCFFCWNSIRVGNTPS